MTAHIGDYSESHRHDCEVRYVAAMPTPSRRNEYLAGVRKERGNAAADRLMAGVVAIFAQRRTA